MRIPKVKVSVNFGRVEEPGWKDINEDEIDKITKDNRWRPGVAILSGTKMKAERRRSLDGYQYKIGEQITESVDAFLPSEYMEWRDT